MAGVDVAEGPAQGREKWNFNIFFWLVIVHNSMEIVNKF